MAEPRSRTVTLSPREAKSSASESPMLTLSTIEAMVKVNGAVVVGTVFGWAGIGSLLIQSINRRDLPLVEATVFVISIMIIGQVAG